MGGSSTPTTQKTEVNLSPEQQELLNLAMPGVRNFAASVPQRYSGPTVAGFDPSQTTGQNMALSAASGPQQQIADNAARTSDFYLSGDIWNPASNPHLQGTIDAATRPIVRSFTEGVAPAIRGEAVSTGNFGSSRQGIAEGVAAGRTAEAVGDTTAKITSDLYRSNLDAQLKALGLAPQTQQLQLAPALTTSGVGDVRQALSQQLLNSDVAGFNYDQMAPFLQSREIASLLAGIPGGGTTATGSTPQPNKLMGALGGAASGAALGSAIFPGVGTAVGAGLGGLLPFLIN